MSHRVLLIALTVLAAYGVGNSAIAHAPSQFHQLQIAQNDETDPTEATPPVPAEPQPAPAVQALQRRLVQLGYYEGDVNGLFDQATRDALAAFQRDQGLVGTGILDPATQARLTDLEAAEPDATEEPNPAAPNPESPSPTSEGSDVLTPPNLSQTQRRPIPQGNAPEDLIESRGADGFTGRLEGGEGAAIAPTAPEANNRLEADPEALSSDAAAAESLEDDELSRLVLIGLGVIFLGGLGTALILWLARQSPNHDAHADIENGFQPLPPMAASASLYPTSNPSSTSAVRRVEQDSPPAAAIAPALDGQLHQSISVGPSAEAKLTKINIVDELIQDLANPDPGARHQTIWDLGQRGNSAAVQPLVSLLMEADSKEQSLILAALSEISMKTLTPMNRAVALALQNDNPEVRKNAIRDLTRIYDSLSQVGRLLGHATVDADPDVRQTAHWALDQLNHIRLSANDSASLLQERSSAVERLPEDDSSKPV